MSSNLPQATVLCFECVCVLLVCMFDIHQVLWCRFYVNSKLHIWKTNWWNVNLSPSIFFISPYLHNGLKYFLEENSHFTLVAADWVVRAVTAGIFCKFSELSYFCAYLLMGKIEIKITVSVHGNIGSKHWINSKVTKLPIVALRCIFWVKIGQAFTINCSCQYIFIVLEIHNFEY